MTSSSWSTSLHEQDILVDDLQHAALDCELKDCLMEELIRQDYPVLRAICFSLVFTKRGYHP
ncbi:MAG: hypothetical protein ACJ0UT_01325 [Candidatus Latescibacterota bacterium]